MRAKLGCCDDMRTKEPQRQVSQPGSAIRWGEQHNTTELSRPSHRERAPHDDGPHAVTDEMEPPEVGVPVELLCFGREPGRMRLDRPPQTSIAPVHRAKPLSFQGAP